MLSKKTSDTALGGSPASAPSGSKLTKGISSRLLGSSGKKTSVLGELLRGSVPPWVQHLRDAGISAEEEKRLAKDAVVCAMCQMSLKTARDLEPANKKVCRCCKAVVCRQCAVHVHLLGHIRRRYVCWKCVGEAAVATKVVSPVVVVEKADAKQGEALPPTLSRQESISSEAEAKNESYLSAFISRLWDTWSGWNGQTEEPISEGDEEFDMSQGDIDHAVAPKALASTLSTDSGQSKIDKMQEVMALSQGKFDGDALKSLLEISHGVNGDPKLVLAVPFTNACKEVMKIMTGLGKAFELAASDMLDKISIVERRTKETAAELKVPEAEVTLQMLVEREIKKKTTHSGKKAAGATRTVVRLLWFLDFISVLLRKLANEPKSSLSSILSSTYETTLGPRHVWMLRRIVTSSMSLVPDKKHFIPKLGLELLSESEQAEKLLSWVESVDSVRTDMWQFIDGHGLANVP